MVFGIALDPVTGQPVCKCCRDRLHHCEKCWNEHHNGLKHKDYEPPEYYGQSMMGKEVREKIEKMLNTKFNPIIKADKNRPYKEGEYH